MGTWGPGPFDNDTAADMVAGLLKPIEKFQAAKDKHDHYEEARAAVALIVAASGTDILGGPSLDTCLMVLNHMRNDEAWHQGWRDPKEIAAALDRQILAVARAMGRHEAIEKFFTETVVRHKKRQPRRRKKYHRAIVGKLRRK